MAGITLSEAETYLSEATAARSKILEGQSVSYNGRSLTRADLKTVMEDIKYWNKEVQRLSRGSLRTYNAVPQG